MRQKLQVKVIVLSVWTVGVILIAHSLRDVIGGEFKEYWFIITALIVVVGTAFIEFLRWVARLAHAESERPEERAPVPGSLVVRGDNAIQGNLTMAEKQTPNQNVLHINSGTSYHNAPGGMLNFGPVTVNQNFGGQQDESQAAQSESTDIDAEDGSMDEMIDINSLIDFSVKLKSPGVSRNTITRILKDADIKPCDREKNGRTIRNLYPRKESQCAVADYLADKNL